MEPGTCLSLGSTPLREKAGEQRLSPPGVGEALDPAEPESGPLRQPCPRPDTGPPPPRKKSRDGGGSCIFLGRAPPPPTPCLCGWKGGRVLGICLPHHPSATPQTENPVQKFPCWTLSCPGGGV